MILAPLVRRYCGGQRSGAGAAPPWLRLVVFVVTVTTSSACAGPQVAARATAAPAATGAASPQIAAIVAGMRDGRGAYARLVELCDGIGHRLSGSPGLEAAIRWATASLARDQHEAVRAEPVQVPVWSRGAESAAIVAPLAAGAEVPLAMLGLGGSVGTAAGGVVAEVLRVTDEAELERRRAEVPGRIVLFDNAMPRWNDHDGSGYGHCVRFRVHGAKMAAALGAVGVLVRSVTAHSLRSPHTGAMSYAEGTPKVPAAAISTEDADRITRLIAAGQTVRVRLQMGAVTAESAASANVVAELRGRERPDEIVIISGHLDSWDVGQGAHDDGAGVVMAMEALHQLRTLGLRPRRTIRVVLWTNEENGMAGVKGYLEQHAAEIPKHVAAIEADSGGFAPVGFGVFADDKAQEARVAAAVAPLLPQLASVGAIELKPGHSAPDVSRFHAFGVPAYGLFTHGERYFDYHHSHADTVDKVDPAELQRSATALAALAFWLADMEHRPDFRAAGAQPSPQSLP